jgi:phage terminase small subunit
MPRAELTGKQVAFVAAYTGEHLFNGTAAARAAGYSSKTDNGLANVAFQNLRKLQVWAAIRARLRTLYASHDLSADRVLNDIELVRQESIRDRNWPAALRASELQGKYMAMFSEKIEHIHTLEDVPLEELVRRANELMRRIDGFVVPGVAGIDDGLGGAGSDDAGDRTAH